jgi:hypothetical protein
MTISIPDKLVSISGNRGAEWLRGKGYAWKDEIRPEPSTATYDDGSTYGVEIPAVNSLAELELIVRLIDAAGLKVTRFNETHGAFLLCDSEIRDMLELCRSTGHGLLLSLGPRPEYDIKASFYRSDFGLEMARRLNNIDAIRVSIEEAFRLVELGCTGLIVYDVGVLRILNLMKREGSLPSSLVLKTSSHCVAANPFIAQILAENGAGSITTTHDLGLSVLQEMRRLNPDVPLDVPTDVYKSKGGFIRFYEMSEIIQVSSPVMLKMGASVQGHPYDKASEGLTRQRIDRVATGLEILARNSEQQSMISPASRHYCLPAANG